MQQFVVIYVDDSGNLQAQPNPLNMSGGDSVVFGFDVPADVDMEGGKNGVNKGLTDAGSVTKGAGESTTINTKAGADGTYTYVVDYPDGTNPSMTIRPQMIIKDK